MDGKKINDVIELRKHLYQEKKIGDQLNVKYYRNGKLMETSLKLYLTYTIGKKREVINKGLPCFFLCYDTK